MGMDVVAQIRRATRKRYTSEEEIRIVLEGLRGETPISELCRREGIAPAMYRLHPIPDRHVRWPCWMPYGCSQNAARQYQTNLLTSQGIYARKPEELRTNHG